MNPHSYLPNTLTIYKGLKVQDTDKNTLFRVLSEEIEKGPVYGLLLHKFIEGEQSADIEQSYNIGGYEIMVAVHCTIWIVSDYENGTAGPNEAIEILNKDAYLYAFYLEGEEVKLTDSQRIELEEAIEDKLDIV